MFPYAFLLSFFFFLQIQVNTQVLQEFSNISLSVQEYERMRKWIESSKSKLEKS